jgi:hypothetical protein
MRGLVRGGIVIALGVGIPAVMLPMPGASFRGALPALTPSQAELRDALRRDVEQLADTIGERHMARLHSLELAADFLEASLAAAGYTVRRHPYDAFGTSVSNLEVEIPGSSRADEVVVIGAHYDSVQGSPGANDNATGAAAVLALARAFAKATPSRTLRFLEFVNEEPPYFQTDAMGSLMYARRCRQRRERIVAMASLETIGYYADEPGSQSYPFPFHFFYPSTGNFIGFVGDLRSRRLVRQAIGSFRRAAQFPSEGVATLATIPGVGWSDQWAFWQQGYPGIMVTDTAPFRYPHYHTGEDMPERIGYERLARVVDGLRRVVHDLVR